MMDTQNQTSCDLLVVDARAEDYDALHSPGALPIALRFFPTGHDALVSLAQAGDAAWLVNAQLPDMTGIELLRLIRQRRPGAHVSLVDDAYSAVNELGARSAGATAYLCKPPQPSWLANQHGRASPKPRHAGPIRAPG